MAGVTCGESCVADDAVVDAAFDVQGVLSSTSSSLSCCAQRSVIDVVEDDDEIKIDVVADVVANVEDNDDDEVIVADDDGVDVIAGVDSKRLTSASLPSSTARRTSLLLFLKEVKRENVDAIQRCPRHLRHRRYRSRHRRHQT